MINIGDNVKIRNMGDTAYIVINIGLSNVSVVPLDIYITYLLPDTELSAEEYKIYRDSIINIYEISLIVKE